MATVARLVWMVSLPPLNIAALPVLRQSAAISIVTLGRASYITPITPNDTL